MMPPGRARKYTTMEITDQRREAPTEINSRMNACIITPTSNPAKTPTDFVEKQVSKKPGQSLTSQFNIILAIGSSNS